MNEEEEDAQFDPLPPERWLGGGGCKYEEQRLETGLPYQDFLNTVPELVELKKYENCTSDSDY